jgi:hypothetical protein
MVQMTPRHDKSAEFLESGVYRPGASIADPDQSAPHVARPIGVGLAAVSSLCIGIFLLLIFTLAILQPSTDNGLPYTIIFPALVALFLAVALWQLYPWARILAVIFYSLLAVTALISAFNSPITLSSCLAVVAPALLVIYLLGKNARTAFEHEVLD